MFSILSVNSAERLIKNGKMPLESLRFEIPCSGGAAHTAVLELRALDSALAGKQNIICSTFGLLNMPNSYVSSLLALRASGLRKRCSVGLGKRSFSILGK